MDNIDTRNRSREDLTTFAEVRVDGETSAHNIRVRNLSPAGMMGEGNLRVARGSRIVVGMRGISPVEGQVAWVQGDRFGVAFIEELKQHQIDLITG